MRGVSLTVLLLALLLGACSFIGDRQPRGGQLLEDGSLLLGTGMIGEQPWTYVIRRRGSRLCTIPAIAEIPVGGGNCTEADEFGRGSGMSATIGDTVIVMEGYLSQSAARLRIEGGGLAAEFPVVSLAPLDALGYAYGIVMPSFAWGAATFLDANGEVVERSELEFR